MKKLTIFSMVLMLVAAGFRLKGIYSSSRLQPAAENVIFAHKKHRKTCEKSLHIQEKRDILKLTFPERLVTG